MKKQLAFVGDLHGSIEALNSVFTKVNLEETTLYFLGDYVDRGKDSFQVLNKLKSLTETEDVHCILGNHDKMFLDFIDFGDPLMFYNDPSLNTLKSFYPDRNIMLDSNYQLYSKKEEGDIKISIQKELRKELEKHPLVKWLRELPYYIETESQIIVHAGIDKSMKHWKDTSESDFIWIRPNSFFKNNTGKDIIAGHTVTYRFYHEFDINIQPNIFLYDSKEFFIDTYNFHFDNARVLLYDVVNNSYKQID